jgi:RNA polymerase sigma factor (sigma-70 family)
VTALQNPILKPLPSIPDDLLAAFVRRHQTALWRFLRICGCSGARAEEIAQDALLVALHKGMAAGDPAEAGAFLRRTARFLWLREVRDERRRMVRHAEAAERVWRQQLAGDDGAGWLVALDACLQDLPPRSRQALERTYRDGLSRQDLGAELGIGEHGVRTLLQRLRAALRTCIERRRKP